MKKHGLVLAFAIVAVALSGCGTSKVDRTASGAGIGAGTGALAGLAFGGVGAIPGALIGAGIGGATGAVTNKDQVYLGQAVWDRSDQGG
jgi:osmotically inducible lipoprotein OsmB